MKKITTYLFLLFTSILFSQPTHNKKVVGYYAQWAIYARDYNVNDIDGNKLTHLMYAFFGIDYDPANPSGTKLKSLDTYADFEHTETGAPWNSSIKGNFYDLKNLKLAHPHLKILISVGGWTKSQNFPAVAASPVARQALANDMANFLATYPFIDGFDIDWEFPIVGGTDGTESVNNILIPAQPHTTNDHKNLVYLLEAMRTAMPNKLITIAAGNSVNNVSQQFIGPNNKSSYSMTNDITTYCDFITFFGYDFGGNWYDKTCYNAPLHPSGNIQDPLHGTPAQALDVLVSIYLNQIGIPASKLVMGVPFYGKLFTNVASSGSVPSLPGLYVSAPRTSSWCTNPQPPQGTWDNINCEYSGSIEYCDLAGTVGTNPHHYLNPSNTLTLTSAASSAGWVRYWDNTCKVPYLYNSTLNQFISYDDTQSIDAKGQYILSQNLAGAMIWELSQDTRGSNPNVLLNQLNTSLSALNSNDFIQDNVLNDFKIYSENGLLHIKSEKKYINEIVISNCLGQMLYEKNNINLNTTSIAIDSWDKNKVIFIEVKDNNGIIKRFKFLL